MAKQVNLKYIYIQSINLSNNIKAQDLGNVIEVSKTYTGTFKLRLEQKKFRKDFSNIFGYWIYKSNLKKLQDTDIEYAVTVYIDYIKKVYPLEDVDIDEDGKKQQECKVILQHKNFTTYVETQLTENSLAKLREHYNVNYNLNAIERDFERFITINRELILMDMNARIYERINDFNFTYDGMTPCYIKFLEIR